MNKCKKCNISTELFFCPNCGDILVYPEFIRDDKLQESRLQSYIKSIITEASAKKIKISSYTERGTLSDAVFRKYFEHILFLQELCSYENVSQIFHSSGQSMIESMKDFAIRCKTNECQIAIAGTIKAGKSMFINAILGREIASTHPTPETAALTKFRYSEKGDYVKVIYYTKEEWDLLWKSVMNANINSIRNDQEDFLTEYNSLKADDYKSQLLDKSEDVFVPRDYNELKNIITKYTSSKYPHHFFAKEVEVGLSSFKMPKNVVFVDTPGLNDPVSFRTDITRRYLHSASVVLLCVKAASAELRASELEDIAILFSELRYSKNRIYLFGTQYDTPTHFSKYWDESTKPEFIKYLSGKSYFGSKENAENKILPVSAWYYNIVQRAKKDEDFWNDESNVDYLAEILSRCLGRQRANQYGTHNDALKKCLLENITEIESKTNVPNIINIIMSGPIKDAEKIILEDIKDIYSNVCDNLVEISANASSLKLEAINIRHSTDLKARIAALDKDIQEKTKNRKKNVESINLILNSLQDINNNIINQINFD